MSRLNQPGQRAGHQIFGSNDSGIGFGLNMSMNFFPHVNSSNYATSMAEVISHRLQHIHFQLSDESDSSHWYDRDENKENICPSLRQNHPYRIFTTPIDEFSIQDLEPDNEENLLPLPTQHENRGEQGTGTSTSPRRPSIFDPMPPRPLFFSSESVLSHSPLHSPDFSPRSHPIHATPRHSPLRRETRVPSEEAELVSVVDLPEINAFGPNGTPPRTPSPESFAEIHGDSGIQDSDDVPSNEQRENERAATLGIGNIAMSASFFTPPSRPLQPPTTPRKKKADKKFLKVIESPSFFPETTVQSHAVKLGSPGKYESFSPRNSTNASSMVLRSSSKPRRSTRIKRMPNRYKCNFHQRADSYKKRHNLLKKHFARKYKQEINC